MWLNNATRFWSKWSENLDSEFRSNQEKTIFTSFAKYFGLLSVVFFFSSSKYRHQKRQGMGGCNSEPHKWNSNWTNDSEKEEHQQRRQCGTKDFVSWDFWIHMLFCLFRVTQPAAPNKVPIIVWIIRLKFYWNLFKYIWYISLSFRRFWDIQLTNKPRENYRHSCNLKCKRKM